MCNFPCYTHFYFFVQVLIKLRNTEEAKKKKRRHPGGVLDGFQYDKNGYKTTLPHFLGLLLSPQFMDFLEKGNKVLKAIELNAKIDCGRMPPPPPSHRRQQQQQQDEPGVLDALVKLRTQHRGSGDNTAAASGRLSGKKRARKLKRSKLTPTTLVFDRDEEDDEEEEEEEEEEDK
jgi:hypothetical protein